MKAILVNPDRSLVWTDVPDPVVGDEDVLVEIHCAALNRADLMQRDGDYPPPPGCPAWMGLEISGIIREVGKVAAEKSDWKVGDEVCALLGGGGYAEYANVKYDMLMPVPKGRSLVEAAAMPEAYATAYLNLRAQPSTAAKVIAQYRNGVRFEVIAQGVSWTKVYGSATGNIGYFMTKYLSLRGLPATPTKTIQNGNTYVNLRSAPSKQTGVVYQRLYSGTSVIVLTPGDEWTQVRCGNTTGYVMTCFLK